MKHKEISSDKLANADNIIELVGASEHIGYIKRAIEKVAKTDDTVLIEGPTGTGKEIIANNIHYKSERGLRGDGRNGGYVIVNCAGLHEEILGSELFGHEKGAFTGATDKREGRFEVANGGTIFLDEIGDMSPSMQVKLLRVLQEGTFERVGGNRPIKTNVRIMAATNKDLLDATTNGSFRSDLYYRLNQYVIYTEPLFGRMEDIICLIHYFRRKKKVKLDPRMRFLLYYYTFPGNTRELKNLISQSIDHEYMFQYMRRHMPQKEFAPVAKAYGAIHNADRYVKDLSKCKPELLTYLKGLKGDIDAMKNLSRRPQSDEAQEGAAIQNNSSFYAQIMKGHKRMQELIAAVVEHAVTSFEVITLIQRTDMSMDDIASTLGKNRNTLTASAFKKNFGFDLPNEDICYSVEYPLDTLPFPSKTDEGSDGADD